MAQIVEFARRRRIAVWGSASGRRDEVGTLLERYCTAVRAHFALEEDVFFPALHGLHPEHGPALEALCVDHVDFGRDLERLGASLEDEELEARRRAFRHHQERMGEHEAREEQVARELAARPPRDAASR